ncbi:MAG: hypothetical protein U0103_24415 [Candidatus Obscuribacterales bacterium]
MSKKNKAPTTISGAQVQEMARLAAVAGKGPNVKQARGAHGGGKRDQHRQDRQNANQLMRQVGVGADFDQLSPRKHRKGKSSMMREVRKK